MFPCKMPTHVILEFVYLHYIEIEHDNETILRKFISQGYVYISKKLLV